MNTQLYEQFQKFCEEKQTCLSELITLHNSIEESKVREQKTLILTVTAEDVLKHKKDILQATFYPFEVHQAFPTLIVGEDVYHIEEGYESLSELNCYVQGIQSVMQLMKKLPLTLTYKTELKRPNYISWAATA